MNTTHKRREEIMKKYKVIKWGKNKGRIKALRSFYNGCSIEKGDIGGKLLNKALLSHDDNCWIDYNATVKDSACVSGDALIKDSAIVKGNAIVSGQAIVKGNAVVSGNAFVNHWAIVRDSAVVSGLAKVNGWATIKDSASVLANAVVGDHSIVKDNATVSGYAVVAGSSNVGGEITTVKGCIYNAKCEKFIYWFDHIHEVTVTDNYIQIGCEGKKPKEWKKWLKGNEEFETKRGTKRFKAIEDCIEFAIKVNKHNKREYKKRNKKEKT